MADEILSKLAIPCIRGIKHNNIIEHIKLIKVLNLKFSFIKTKQF